MFTTTPSGFAIFKIDNHTYDVFRGTWEPWSRFSVNNGKLLLQAGTGITREEYNELKTFLL